MIIPTYYNKYHLVVWYFMHMRTQNKKSFLGMRYVTYVYSYISWNWLPSM